MSRLRKLLLYSHDTYGLGHLRRNLAIASHLLAATPGLQVILLSGSPVSEYFPRPDGLALVQLPAVTKVGADQYLPRDGRVSFNLVRRARTAIMIDVATRFRPDVLLVDHAPRGMGGELLDVLTAVRHRSPDTRTVLGLRDVLDDPATVRQSWADHGVYELLARSYDDVVVYGRQEMFDVGLAYGLPASIRARLHYCGYIGRREPAGEPHQRTESPFVLATAGGGGDGVEVLAAAIEASAALGIAARVVTGPLMSAADRCRLQQIAQQLSPPAQLLEFVPSLRALARSAAAVVTMGGYNTLCELASTTAPVIVMPRTHPRTEQAIRAEMFSRRGLVDVVLPGPEVTARLARTLARAMAAPPPAREPLDLGGLDRLSQLLGSRTGRPCHHAPQMASA